MVVKRKRDASWQQVRLGIKCATHRAKSLYVTSASSRVFDLCARVWPSESAAVTFTSCLLQIICLGCKYLGQRRWRTELLRVLQHSEGGAATTEIFYLKSMYSLRVTPSDKKSRDEARREVTCCAEENWKMDEHLRRTRRERG